MNTTPDVEAELSRIERERGCRVPFAIESGSRAWGFASRDSDFDVRFVYVRPEAWYLSIDAGAKRDVIEEPVDAVLDVSGWDLVKALNLYRRSNPPLYEWLHGPIVYRDRLGLRGELRELARSFYNPKAAAYHYLRMTNNSWRQYLQKEVVRTKKYLYALRPVMAVLWIERGLGVVPVPFEELMDAVLDEPEVRAAVDDLVAEKARTGELGERPRDPVLHAYLRREMTRLEAVVARIEPPPPGPVERLNEVFRRVLREAWQTDAA